MLIIVLIVVTAASVAALFLRGFRVQDFTAQLKAKDVETPTLDVWLVEGGNYDSKMDAYKAGLAAANQGWGVYVLPVDGKWAWVASVCNSEAEAQSQFEQSGLSSTASVKLYTIKGKKFAVDESAFSACQQVLSAVRNVYDLLLEMRQLNAQYEDIGNLQINLTSVYNQIKDGVETLQTVNESLQSDFITTVIYAGNQNVLGLQGVISTNSTVSASTINNALLKTIFSLDNF
ncbi:MAG: hypothetical protein KIG16_00710 [Eubacteriales bacterium]|nr:hypothetical protein [Eubacteriales bacterium]